MTTHAAPRPRTIPAATIALALLALATAAADARAQRPGRNGRNEMAIVEMANGAFQDVATNFNSEQAVPQVLLQQAEGILIIPNMIKAGFVIGGKHGRGVLLVRTAKGTWSNPVFVTLSGGSVGLQIGAQSSELLLVFRNRAAVQRVLSGRDKLTLGGNVGVAAGPVGKQLGAGTDPRFRAEILSYARSRGLFAGASVDGSVLAVDWAANNVYYNLPGVRPAEIVGGAEISVPPSGTKLKALLDLHAPPLKVEEVIVDGPAEVIVPPGTVIKPADEPPTIIESTVADEPATTPGASFKATDPDSTATPAKPKARAKPAAGRSNPDDIPLPDLAPPN
ncbi:lipid-binding SYLF domain-containing protein [Isosphaeraceae bacterium EP7]